MGVVRTGGGYVKKKQAGQENVERPRRRGGEIGLIARTWDPEAGS